MFKIRCSLDAKLCNYVFYYFDDKFCYFQVNNLMSNCQMYLKQKDIPWRGVFERKAYFFIGKYYGEDYFSYIQFKQPFNLFIVKKIRNNRELN